MRQSSLLRIALRNVARHRRYTGGAIAIVALGYAAVALFRLYMIDAAHTIGDVWEHRFMYGHLIVERTATDA